jgi:hypothetical protein
MKENNEDTLFTLVCIFAVSSLVLIGFLLFKLG